MGFTGVKSYPEISRSLRCAWKPGVLWSLSKGGAGASSVFSSHSTALVGGL